MSISLEFSLHDIILTITFLAGVGNHRCHFYNLDIFVHFFPIRFLYPHQIKRNLFDISYIFIRHILFLPHCWIITCPRLHLSQRPYLCLSSSLYLSLPAIFFLLEFKFSHKQVLQSDHKFQFDKIKRRNKSLQKRTLFDLNIELLPYYMKNSHTFYIRSIFFVLDLRFE